MARPKTPKRTITTEQDASTALGDLLVWQLEQERQAGAMDLEVCAVHTKYEPVIDNCKTQIADIKLALQVWYMANQEKLEKAGKKSLRLATGVIGRRLGNKALVLLNRACTWASSLVILRNLDRDDIWHDYTPRELDREAAVAKLTAEELAKAGLKVAQEQRFFAEPDRSLVK